ncbi:hypothetical protein L3X38_040875 [Prunus dulcis]|uniref:NB-ARC domain-containing protein n=1 Tax=Prunus dulcis TaxID=3755 RepID=A0AAD4UTU9_PRUDU|nr:hypothetical protein L3X38_040875 [Prunus dulcis]
MGGSGKTTLVAKTFKSVKRHFSCYAWITVSQSYVIEDLFRSLIKEVHQATKEEVPAAADLNSMIHAQQPIEPGSDTMLEFYGLKFINMDRPFAEKH